MNWRRLGCGLCFALWLGVGMATKAAELPPAYALAHAGNQFISPKAKDAITELHSAKSVGGLQPNIWYVEYYDPSVAMKATEVEFVDGKKFRVRHPFHFAQLFTGVRRLPWRKMKFDSNQALATALAAPELKGLQLRADQLTLQRTPTDPVWKIRFWAARPTDPGKIVGVGQITISARNGAILKNEIHPPK